MLLTKVRLLNAADLSVVDYDVASDIIIRKALKKKSYSVFAMPVHGLVEAHQNPSMMRAVRTASMIVPDGQPVRWAMNYLYNTRLKDRVYGPKLTLHVLEKADALNMKVFLYGGSSPAVLRQFQAFIETNYPGIQVCGTYREEQPKDDTLTAERVNESGAQIVLVGRGCPKQEIWISNQMGAIQCPMLGVGAAFSFYAGTVQQAPAWMQNAGLEWLYRLSREPKRLFKRYLVTNSLFIWLVLHQIIKVKLLGMSKPSDVYQESISFL